MLLPAVTVFRNTIHVPICVGYDAEHEKYEVFAAHFVLPKGFYRVIWSLITLDLPSSDPERYWRFCPSEGCDAGVGDGEKKPGIAWKSLPPAEVLRFKASHRVSETQWMAFLDNCCTKWGFQAEYDIHLFNPTRPGVAPRPALSYDPVILVSKDPVEIPDGRPPESFRTAD